MLKPFFPEPFFLQFHPVDRCNLSCSHCYRDELKPDMKKEQAFIVIDQFRDLLEVIKKKGRLHIAGGEPLLCDYLDELISYAQSFDIPSRILTNGCFLTEKRAELLKEAGCKIVQVSIDGDKTRHEEIRGKNTFEQALQGMKNARKNKMEVTLSFTVMKSNINCLDSVIKIACDHADRIGIGRVVTVGSAKSGSESLTPEETKRLMDFVVKAKKKYSQIEFAFRDPLWNFYFNNKFFLDPIITGCSAGYNGFSVDSDGTVYPCRRLPVSAGNIKHNSLVDIWQNSEILKTIRNRDKLKGKCGNCRIKTICGGCRAIAYADTGNFLTEDTGCYRKLVPFIG